MKKISIITTSRAEYGLLYCLIKEIEKDEDMCLQLVVGGSHLSPEFGQTVLEIEADGVQIDERVEFLLSSDTGVGAAKAAGLAAISFADTLDRLRPDIIVLLGDRYEILAVALAATLLNIPIAHIHGGEITQGVIDDRIRHALTKLACVHFPACERYAKRILQMGEQKESVFNHGAIGLDQLSNRTPATKKEVEKILGIKFLNQVFVCTYHPLTSDVQSGLQDLVSLLKVFEFICDTTIIFTKANSDSTGRQINELLENFCKKSPEKFYLFDSLGIKRYRSLLSIADLIIGNSSSGLIEAPFLGVSTVNIGERQQGRELASTVINCEGSVDSIQLAIKTALSKNFREKIFYSPYVRGGAAVKIKDTLKNLD